MLVRSFRLGVFELSILGREETAVSTASLGRGCLATFSVLILIVIVISFLDLLSYSLLDGLLLFDLISLAKTEALRFTYVILSARFELERHVGWLDVEFFDVDAALFA